jgi:EAL domain-containing protein (putative c-di-GMP-specific phosphodiesterase class I)
MDRAPGLPHEQELTAAGMGNLQVAINLSPKQFSDPDLVASIANILKEEALPATCWNWN